MTQVQNFLHKSARKKIHQLVEEQCFCFACHACKLLAEGAGSEQNWIRGSRGPLLHDICVLLQFISKHFFRTCGFTVCLRRRIRPPEIDLFLRPYCLLNIIDHQSCHREEKKRSCYMCHKKESFLWTAIYLRNVLVKGQTLRRKIGHISTTNTTTLGGCRIN